MKLEVAQQLADELIPILKPYCERVEVAGGIRRRKEEPHDIELVAKPIFKDHTGELVVETLDGTRPLPLKPLNELDIGMHKLMRDRVIQEGKMRTNHRNGKEIPMRAPFSEKYYNFQFKGESVDLFVVTPPADWGPIFTIRTGDAAFTHWMVSYGWPKGIEFDKGNIMQHLDEKDRYVPIPTKGIVPGHHRVQIPAPEEMDVFRILGLPHYTPEQRSDPHIYTGALMSV